MGYKNQKTASDTWYLIKKKMGIVAKSSRPSSGNATLVTAGSAREGLKKGAGSNVSLSQSKLKRLSSRNLRGTIDQDMGDVGDEGEKEPSPKQTTPLG